MIDDDDSPAQCLTHLCLLIWHADISKLSRGSQRSQLSCLAELSALALSSLDEQQIIQATSEPSEVQVGSEEPAQGTDQVSCYLGPIQLLHRDRQMLRCSLTAMTSNAGRH